MGQCSEHKCFDLEPYWWQSQLIYYVPFIIHTWSHREQRLALPERQLCLPISRRTHELYSYGHCHVHHSTVLIFVCIDTLQLFPKGLLFLITVLYPVYCTVQERRWALTELCYSRNFKLECQKILYCSSSGYIDCKEISNTWLWHFTHKVRVIIWNTSTIFKFNIRVYCRTI